MKAISVHVDEERYEELQSMARRSGRPVAALIREAMDSYAETQRGRGPSLLDLPAVSAGRPLKGWTRSEIYDEMLGSEDDSGDEA